ncbi:MAG: FMN-binding negative transcriptional regulator [Rhodospirillales bacterium]|nr:FMN-binding negative transcriptional regulator [Rhodospirillales bacterium]
MYVPPAFASPDDAATARLVAENGFAILVATGADGVPVAAHIPIQHDAARGVLIGHLAGPNPLADTMDDCARAGREVLAIFQGAHGYVSPSWYAAKKNTVPTWNYAAAHVYGVPTMIDDATRLREIVDALARQYETHGWTLDAQDPDFVDRMLSGIVGFEIAISHLEGKFKMSQNRNAADREGVLAGLEASGRPDDVRLARAMRDARR